MFLLYDFIKELLLNYGFYLKLATYGAALGTFIILVIFSLIIFFIVRLILVKIIGRLVKHTKGIWDNALFSHRVFHVMAHFVPALIIYSSSGFAGSDLTWLPAKISLLAKCYFLAVFVSASIRFINSVQDIYNSYPYSKERPIKGYLQLMKIFIYCTGGIFIMAFIFEQNPASIFAGLGAMTAVLIFVFKDPILGFVASIQLAANKMVKPGDWITVPKFNIDGKVEDISLSTVKIQNWDMTITTIPTYSLISEPMINWIGMTESGGRRIRRSISIDMTSVRICDEELTAKIKKIPYLDNLISFRNFVNENFETRENEISLNTFMQTASTNLSLFKKYLETYCITHSGIHENMTRIVRFLQSDEKGLPIEIIVFSKYQEMDAFESLQAEIFNHILAILPEFELRVYQNPSVNIIQYPASIK
jgi:miniconductance mechanosensitive channel